MWWWNTIVLDGVTHDGKGHLERVEEGQGSG